MKSILFGLTKKTQKFKEKPETAEIGYHKGEDQIGDNNTKTW